MTSLSTRKGSLMRIHSALAAAVVVAVFPAGDAWGQSRVSGKVTDQWGNGLAGVQIVVERRDGGSGGRTATTEDSGDFFMLGLPTAGYDFTFTLDGYQGVRFGTRIAARDNRPIEIELAVNATGVRLRGEQDFEAAGGSPKIKFKEDGVFEFEDAEGEEGEGTYGIVDLEAHLVVRDYEGDDDRYSHAEPVVVTFANDQFRSLTWDGATLDRK